jgi:hypothetical protein
VIAVLLIGLAIINGLLVAASARLPSLVTTLLVAYLAFVGNLVLVVLVLSPFREVTRGGLAAAEACLFGVSLAAWWVRGRPRLAVRDAWRALRVVAGDPVAATFLAVVIVALAYELLLALSVPPNNQDSLTYHLARVAAWAQHGGIHWIPNAPSDRLNEFQPLAEEEILFLFVATGKGALFALPQYLAEVATLVAVYGASRRLGFDVRAAACSAFLLATFALVALEATTAQNDLVAASFPAAAACLILAGSRLETALAGVAIAMGADAKLTTVLVWPVLAFLLLLRGRTAVAVATAGGIVGFVLVGIWAFVLNVARTGHLLGQGRSRNEWTASPSFPGSLRTALHVLYRALDLGAYSYRFAYVLAGVGVITAAAVAQAYSRRGFRRSLVQGAAVAVPFLSPVLVILGAFALAWLTDRAHIPVHAGGWAGGLNRVVIEDSSAFGPLGAVLLVSVPVLAVGAYFAGRVDSRHLALALSLPIFLILLALQAAYNPWLTRFLLVPAALTAPLFGMLFRHRAVTAAFVIVASLTLWLTLQQNRNKPLESRYGPPWQLTWSESLKPRGGGALFGVLDDYNRLVPARACVGAVVGPDEPSYLLYGPRLEHRVFYLPVEDPYLQALRHHLFYVVISAGVDRKAAPAFTKAGWKLKKLGDYWLSVISPASGAKTGRC